MNAHKVLIILTSHGQLGKSGKPTGFWFEELAAPYYEFVAAGARVDLGSPAGGRPPVDPGSQANAPASVQRFLSDPEAVAKLEATRRLTGTELEYDAYFVAGGHGAMWDLAGDTVAARLLGAAIDSGKVVAAVCHGPAALVGAKLKNGESILKGKRVTGFSNEEEAAVHLTDTVPFLIESRLVELGASYQRGATWGSFALRDGRLVTGQNPQSSVATAREVLNALRAAPAAVSAGART